MGELHIHIKVLKNSPILFTWLNKETDCVEGCLVTCPCQKLGLTEKSGQSAKSTQKPAPVDQKLLGQALQKATILSTPEGAESRSVLIPVRKIRIGELPSCGNTQKLTQNSRYPKQNGKIKFTTCADERVSNNHQPSKTLTIRLTDDFIGIKQNDFQHTDDNEGRLTGDVNSQSDKKGTGLLAENNSIETDRVSEQGSVDEEILTKIILSPPVKTLVNQSDKSDESNLKEEERFGTRVDSSCEEENQLDKTGDKCKTTASNVQSHQGKHTQFHGNLHETVKRETSDSGNVILSSVESQDGDIIIHNNITDPGGGDDKIVQIEIGSSLRHPSYVGKDYRDSMSEMERTLYDALKSLIDPCTTDLKQHSNDTNTASVLCPSIGMGANPNTESPEPKVDSLSKGNMSTAMLKYRQYENEKFLKKLHKLGEQKVVHAVICEVCGALLTNKRLKDHMVAFHSLTERKRNFECSCCHKKFLKAANLERHKLTHTDYMSKCQFCMKSFKYDYTRKAHEKRHLANPPPAPVRKPRQQKKGRSKENGNVDESHETLRIFTCDICGKSVRFCSKYQHLKTHKEKKYPCTICDFRLGTKAALKMHMKKHTKECNIPCRICGKLFKRYQERLNHERVHTGEKPFICQLCDRRWRDRATYQGHMNKHHPGVPLMYLRPPIETPLGRVTSSENARVPEEA